MRLLLGAQSCGYGPISKLAALSRRLDHHDRLFVGTTVAADFARRNADAFDDIVEAGAGVLDRLIEGSDYVVSVMDADLVLRAYAANRPALMVDSLFSFWQLRTPPRRIADLCAVAPRGDHAALDAHFAELAPHERIYAAHLLADVSVVQNFPGVTERAAEARELKPGRIEVTGPIVDEQALAGVGAASAPNGPGHDLLINLGGFKNFLLDYDRHNDYLRLFDRWVPDLLRDWPALERVAVCGGGYGNGRERRVQVGGRVAEFGCMPHREFLPAVASARHYMLTPGLTAIHESLRLGQLPMALPEQHYGHIVNLESLAGTLFHRLGVGFSQCIDDYRVPADDFEGTAAIVRQTGRLLEDDSAYAGFRRAMNTRIEEFLATGPAARAGGVAELRRLLRGPSFGDLLAEVLPARTEALIGGRR
ncbi:hypothetical protein [Streptomyces sp. NPDC046909]|uniref:hypothetical protein n=1 Tax=Streptomyces sp. NPDC046909 TaxID=3155617 RepID=UPI0033E5D086